MSTVKGKAPRKPRLTYEVCHALDRINGQVCMITADLQGLSERALKGLAFEAHRMSTLEDEAIWRGVADEAKRWEAIRAAQRTGRGEWYAVLDVMRESREDPRILENVTTAHVKCVSLKEASEAGRRLMVEKAEWLCEGTFVEVRLYSALEWRAEDGE